MDNSERGHNLDVLHPNTQDVQSSLSLLSRSGTHRKKSEMNLQCCLCIFSVGVSSQLHSSHLCLYIACHRVGYLMCSPNLTFNLVHVYTDRFFSYNILDFFTMTSSILYEFSSRVCQVPFHLPLILHHPVMIPHVTECYTSSDVLIAPLLHSD